MLISPITFSPMFRPRIFLDADASNGSGSDDPVDVTPPVDQAPPAKAEPAKDPNAGTRYQISRERTEKERIQKEFDDYKVKTSQAPKKFDTE